MPKDKEDVSREHPSDEEKLSASRSCEEPTQDSGLEAERDIKKYYTVKQLSKKWKLPEEDVYHFGAIGELPLAYRLPLGGIEEEGIPDGEGGYWRVGRHDDNECFLHVDGLAYRERREGQQFGGPKHPDIYYVHPDDVHRVISKPHEATAVHRLYYDSSYDYEEIALFYSEPPLVTPTDLLVMREDCTAFEQKINLTAPNVEPDKKTERHGNARRYDSRRAKVLGAALAILKAFPKECGTPREIARLVRSRSNFFWREDENVPEIERMARLIRGWLEKHPRNRKK